MKTNKLNTSIAVYSNKHNESETRHATLAVQIVKCRVGLNFILVCYCPCENTPPQLVYTTQLA